MTKRKKDKQRSTRHYTEHLSSSNTKPTKNRGWTQVFPRAKQFPLHMHTSCYACYKPSDKSLMRTRLWLTNRTYNSTEQKLLKSINFILFSISFVCIVLLMLFFSDRPANNLNLFENRSSFNHPVFSYE
jgi:hypothetical protein